jgi:hypothetical protein
MAPPDCAIGKEFASVERACGDRSERRRLKRRAGVLEAWTYEMRSSLTFGLSRKYTDKATTRLL